MGRAHLHRLVKGPDVRVAALCDVDQQVLARVEETVKNETGQSARSFQDFRHVLDVGRHVVITTMDQPGTRHENVHLCADRHFRQMWSHPSSQSVARRPEGSISTRKAAGKD